MVDYSRKRLSCQEACILLRCSKNRFYALVREGILPAWHLEGKKKGMWVYEDDCLKLFTVVHTKQKNDFAFKEKICF